MTYLETLAKKYPAYAKAMQGVASKPAGRGIICLYNGKLVGERKLCRGNEEHTCDLFNGTIIHNADCQTCTAYSSGQD